jgi:DNA-binding TFAR19-related protein (PDSD5 family)
MSRYDIILLFQPDALAPDQDERNDTDKNMAVMFDLLVHHKSVKLEHLILNRQSFAQTVENIFALSFLVKDGRAEINVVDSGDHFVGKVFFFRCSISHTM